MARTVKHSKLESRTARARLKRGRQPHWQALVTGPRPVHLGWQAWKGDPEGGRWVVRRYLGRDKYSTATIGRADDAAPADGERVLSYKQADERARAMLLVPNGGQIKNLTVRDAIDRYVVFKSALGQPVGDLLCRAKAHIYPVLGDLIVSELTADVLRRWLSNLAASRAQTRPKAGRTQYRPAADDEEAVRRRRASANRVLTMLKAALNHAFDEGNVTNRDAWGRKLKPFSGVAVARTRYLALDESRRLINACDPAFRALVRAALETGARYGELCALEVADFNADAGAIAIRKSKSGKSRHVILTKPGCAFFRQQTIGRVGSELMFQHSGTPWKSSDQGRRMLEACARAHIEPPISFHGLRHTWASLSVMNAVPLMVVAKNLGHRDTRMVEHHYGHLAESYVVDAIRAGAPRYVDDDEESSVVPLSTRRSS